MNAYLGHTYALKCWKIARANGFIPHAYVTRALPSNDTIAGIREIQRSGVFSRCAPARNTLATHGAEKVDLLVADRSCRRPSKRVACAVWDGPIPDGSLATFDQWGQNVVVSTPAFVLLQEAAVRPLAQLVQLAMEVCGRYEVIQDQRGYDHRLPQMATLAQLKAYAHEALQLGCYAAETLKAALDLAFENSWSHMETNVVLRAFLPIELGGYFDLARMPYIRPVLNQVLHVPQELQSYAKRKSLIPDILIECIRLIIEYDGRVAHASGRAQSMDNRKYVTYGKMRYEARRLNDETAMNVLAFEEFLEEIAQLIGCEFQRKTGSDAALRDTLYEQLHGRPPRY